MAKDQTKHTSGSVSIDPPALAVPPGGAGGAPVAPLSSRSDIIPEMEPVADAQAESVIPDNSAEFYSDKLPSLLEQVAREGVRLKIGCPEYQIWEDPDKKGYFAGRPVFKKPSRVPEDIGHVAGAISKNLAKELIAEELLKYYRTELDRRHGIMGSFGKAPEQKSVEST